MLPIILTIVAAGFLYGGASLEKFNGPISVIGILLAVVAVLSWIVIPISCSVIEGEIYNYNQQKFIIQHTDLKGMSDLRKAQVLEPFLMIDRTMRYYKSNYNSFWLDLYMPDDKCKNIELMKGW